MTDYDPRLVELYDDDNPDGPDHDFYRALADESGAGSILDLGCGTGILTVTLAREGRRVVGADPSPAMLAFARRRPGAERVVWVDGDSGSAPGEDFDLAVMTGNVAQHIPDSDWARTLADLRRALRRGGLLAFESRNPDARAWENWAAGRSVRETRHGVLTEWCEVRTADERTGTLIGHNVFASAETDVGSGVEETVTEEQQLVFRSREELERDLHEAGFDIEAIYRDWTRTPFDGGGALMVFVARAR